MEDSTDMDMSTLWPQKYLFSCELKANRDDHFKVDNDENGHKLSLKTVSLGAVAKDELHIVETEAMNYEGSPIKVTLATLETSVRPMVSLGGFERTPPVVLRLKCGSGPVRISGQHFVAVEEEAESGDEEEEDVKLLSISGKQSAPGDDVDDDFDDEETEEKVPVKKSIRDTPAKSAQKSNQNGKDSKPSTPNQKDKNPSKNREKTPKTPPGPSSVEDVKAKLQASIEKGDYLPKVESKFINYVNNGFRMTDQEAIQDLW
ncbi:hypothetical protein H8958_011971 [Nasalis larvatus]